MMKISGLLRSIWTLNGSIIDSSSRFDGRDSLRNMILGKMLRILILTTGPNSYKETMILTLKMTSITDTLTLQNRLTLLLNEDSQPGSGGPTISPWGHGPLVGGTVMISHVFIPIIYSVPFCAILLHSWHLPLLFALIAIAHCALQFCHA